jgi:hypothetical protein
VSAYSSAVVGPTPPGTILRHFHTVRNRQIDQPPAIARCGVAATSRPPCTRDSASRRLGPAPSALEHGAYTPLDQRTFLQWICRWGGTQRESGSASFGISQYSARGLIAEGLRSHLLAGPRKRN